MLTAQMAALGPLYLSVPEVEENENGEKIHMNTHAIECRLLDSIIIGNQAFALVIIVETKTIKTIPWDQLCIGLPLDAILKKDWPDSFTDQLHKVLKITTDIRADPGGSHEETSHPFVTELLDSILKWKGENPNDNND